MPLTVYPDTASAFMACTSLPRGLAALAPPPTEVLGEVGERAVATHAGPMMASYIPATCPPTGLCVWIRAGRRGRDTAAAEGCLSALRTLPPTVPLWLGAGYRARGSGERTEVLVPLAGPRRLDVYAHPRVGDLFLRRRGFDPSSDGGHVTAAAVLAPSTGLPVLYEDSFAPGVCGDPSARLSSLLGLGRGPAEAFRWPCATTSTRP